jgi:uncharacterized membrane protein YgcG
MTAATASIGHRSARARILRHWERTLVILGICLPVPALALTGLSIPLPTTVERLAAALVPWAETSSAAGNDALSTGTRGAIVRTTTEAREALPVPVAASNPHPQAAPGATSDNGAKDGPRHNDGGGGGGGGAGGSGGGSDSGGSSGGGGSGGGGGHNGGGDPGPGDPVQDVVGVVEGTVGGVVEDTTDAVDEATDTVEDVVDSVEGILGGLGK